MHNLKQKVVAAIKEHGFDAGKIAAATGLSLGVVQSAMAAATYTDLVAAADFAGLGVALTGVIVVLIGTSLVVAGGLAIWALTKKGRSV